MPVRGSCKIELAVHGAQVSYVERGATNGARFSSLDCRAGVGFDCRSTASDILTATGFVRPEGCGRQSRSLADQRSHPHIARRPNRRPDLPVTVIVSKATFLGNFTSSVPRRSGSLSWVPIRLALNFTLRPHPDLALDLGLI